jgi:hypothetical protein
VLTLCHLASLQHCFLKGFIIINVIVIITAAILQVATKTMHEKCLGVACN